MPSYEKPDMPSSIPMAATRLAAVQAGHVTSPAPAGHAALRRGRASIAGQAYVVTFTTLERHRCFGDLWFAQAAIAGMLHPPIWRTAMLWCWVAMPDHVHLLVQLGQGGNLATLVRNVKANASRRTRLMRSGRLWAKAYHQRALRTDESLRVAARYIVANPLRAGLVDHVADYPFWGAAWLTHPGAPPIPV